MRFVLSLELLLLEPLLDSFSLDLPLEDSLLDFLLLEDLLLDCSSLEDSLPEEDESLVTFGRLGAGVSALNSSAYLFAGFFADSGLFERVDASVLTGAFLPFVPFLPFFVGAMTADIGS